MVHAELLAAHVVTGRAPQAHERIGERAPLLSGDLSPEAGDPGGDVPARMHGKKCPLTLQEAKPKAGSSRSPSAAEADRGSELKPGSRRHLIPGRRASTGSDTPEQRPPDEK